MTAETRTHIPHGLGGKLEEHVNKDSWAFFVQFEPVKNTVIEVNPHINAPFNLVIGEPSPLGLFAHSSYLDWESLPQYLSTDARALECLREHKRTALLGRALFADDRGTIYRDIDLKGIGYIESDSNSGSFYIANPGGLTNTGGVLGLLDRDVALEDYMFNEDFIKAGIRTYRTIAILETDEVVIDGKVVSLKQARRKKLIPWLTREFHPVIQVRAFTTRARVQNLDHKTDPELRRLLFEDARLIISQELGKKPFSDETYLRWFAGTLGKNVALMHRNGWIHRYLSPHNVTLDCRIVDLDSVAESFSDNDRAVDRAGAKGVLRNLVDYYLGVYGRESEIFGIFDASYESTIPKRITLFKK